jgi:cellulose biosynthesis protein BcsQ
MGDWWQQLLGLAAAVGALATLFRMGFAVGRRERVRELEREIDTAKGGYAGAQTDLLAARRDMDVLRDKLNTADQRYKELEPSVGDRMLQNKLEDVRNFIGDPNQIWRRRAVQPQLPRKPQQGGMPILTVANLKGGVGKTTLATHLAGFYGKSGKKVLFVDFDFQGSGSTYLLRAAQTLADVAPEGRYRAERLLSSNPTPVELATLPIPLGAKVPNVSVVPAYYPFAAAEDATMLRWLIGDEPNDIRFNLCRTLQSGNFTYDLVIIDAAPRLSTATVQALAASTHVLIPTEYERKASEAAVYFNAMIGQLREANVCYGLDVVGVVPNKAPPPNDMVGVVNAETKFLVDALGEGLVWSDVRISDRVAFRNEKLVFDQTGPGPREAQEMIGSLAAKLETRLWP